MNIASTVELLFVAAFFGALDDDFPDCLIIGDNYLHLILVCFFHLFSDFFQF